MTNGDDTAAPPDIPSTPESDTATQANQATPAQQPQTPAQPQEDAADPVLQASLKAQQEDQKREAEAQSYYDKMRSQISEIDQRIKSAPIPAVPQHMQIPELPQQQQQQRGTIGTIIQQAVSIAAIGAVIFGRRHNGWANAAMFDGVGSFINGYTKAQHEAATEQLQNWNRSVEYAQKQNAAADKTYNEALSNTRLDMTQQMDLIKTVAAQRQDVEMYKAAASKDMNQVIKVMNDKLKARGAAARAQVDANSRGVNQWLKGKVGNSWSMHVFQESKGAIDPSKSHADFMKGYDKYPPSDWINSYQEAAKKAKEKPVTFEFAQKEATAALGKDNVEKWSSVIDGSQKPVRGDFDKDGNWKNDPKGSLYATPESIKPHGGLLGIGDTTTPNRSETASVKTIDQLMELRQRANAGGSSESGGEEGVKKTASGAALKIQTPLTSQEAKAKVASGELSPGDWFQGTNGKNYQVPTE